MFNFIFIVHQFHAWTFGPSISCLDILMVRHFHVRHFQHPLSFVPGLNRQECWQINYKLISIFLHYKIIKIT